MVLSATLKPSWVGSLLRIYESVQSGEIVCFLVQAVVRGYAQRQRFAKERGALIIQRNMRKCFAVKSFAILKRRHCCAVRVQHWWRNVVLTFRHRSKKRLEKWRLQQVSSNFQKVHMCYSKHLRTLASTLGLQDALARILSFCRIATERQGRVQKIGTIKLKHSIVRQLAYTRLYDEGRVADETSDYRAKFAHLQHKRRVLEKVVLQRVSLEDSIVASREAENHMSSQSRYDRVLHARMLRKIETLGEEVTLMSLYGLKSVRFVQSGSCLRLWLLNAVQCRTWRD